MKKKWTSFLAAGIALAFSGAALVHGQITFDQVILEDNFNSGTPGESVLGQSTSDGQAAWQGGGPSGDQLFYDSVNGSNVLRAENHPNGDEGFGVAWIDPADFNANNYANYQVEFGNLTLEQGQGIGYLMLSGRKSFSDIAGGYRFRQTSGGDWEVQFRQVQADPWDDVGTILEAASSLDNLQLRVMGDEQQLFLNNVALFPDDGWRPTQGSLDDESNALIEILTNSAPGTEFVETTLNDMTIAVPEPSTYALLFGAGVFGIVLLMRRRANGK